MNIESLIRQDLKGMKAYSSARDEFEGAASIFLDANENPNNNGVNRYPDPLQRSLKNRISQWKKVSSDKIFLGNGSDECIDLLIRLFCTAGKDELAAMAPSYGMYAVSSRINNCRLREILLNEDFTFPTKKIISESKGAKLLFLCSPNNPTGFSIPESDVVEVLEAHQGIVVIDEAYIDFSSQKSVVSWLSDYPNLVVCQTLSKAVGLAGIRLGMLFASEEIVSWLNKIKPPYNINQLTQEFALNYLEKMEEIDSQTKEITAERNLLEKALIEFPFVEQVYSSDANFILARIDDANKLYVYLISLGIVVRNRSTQVLCQNTLRFSVGTKEENNQLINALTQYKK
ncbi:MAG: histidinol-phosphate transaminase [Bacteroidota bacterium]